MDKLKSFEDKQSSEAEQHNIILANLKSNLNKENEALR